MIKQLYSIFLNSSGVSTDTRSLKGGELFFCLKGEQFNGNKFAKQAIEKGAYYVVLDDNNYLDDANEKMILVSDSLEMLQLLSEHHRQQLSIPIIGITGSNGKTTTKELLAAVLSTQFNVFATQGNLNNHIGVPLSLLQITDQHDMAVIEMGANHVGEIAELCQLSQPEFGILTNIGHAHLEGFGSYENIKKTKLALYKSVKSKEGLVFVHQQDEVLMQESKNIKRLTYGLSDFADVKVQLLSGQTTLVFKYEDQIIKTQLFGEYNIYNAAAALAVGQYFKISADKMALAISGYLPSNNRSQIERGPHNLLILDAYNANPDSMKNAIEFFGDQKAESKTLILGDMLELGEFEESKHKEVLELINQFKFNHCFLVGEAFGALKNEFNQFTFFENSEIAKDHFSQFPIRNNHILLKGSRGIRLEKLKDILL
jgi:UDP-N-acetylmuramoyl-tripeptide--D-alanyl-D-alanine ligase